MMSLNVRSLFNNSQLWGSVGGSRQVKNQTSRAHRCWYSVSKQHTSNSFWYILTRKFSYEISLLNPTMKLFTYLFKWYLHTLTLSGRCANTTETWELNKGFLTVHNGKSRKLTALPRSTNISQSIFKPSVYHRTTFIGVYLKFNFYYL